MNLEFCELMSHLSTMPLSHLFHHQLPLFEFPWTDGTLACAFFSHHKTKNYDCCTTSITCFHFRRTWNFFMQATDQREVSLSQYAISSQYESGTGGRFCPLGPFKLLSSIILVLGLLFFLNTGLSPTAALRFSARLKQETKGSVERKWAVALEGWCFWPIVWFLRTSCRHFTVECETWSWSHVCWETSSGFSCVC